jgi:hypothetical protein
MDIISIENIKPALFHFLDGSINENIGDTINNIIRFLKTNKLVLNNIYIIINELTNNFIYNNIYININKDNDDEGEFTINLKNFSDKYAENLNIYKKIFKYCIIQRTNDNHATSILIFEKDNKLNLLTFNSGFDLDIHNSYNNEYYKPYKGYIICDDIKDYDKYKEAIEKIFLLLTINDLYKMFNTLGQHCCIEIKSLSTDTTKTINNKDIIIFDKLYNYINEIYETNFFNYFNENITLYKYNGKILTIKNIKTLEKRILYEKIKKDFFTNMIITEKEYYTLTDLDTQISSLKNETYYKFFHNFLKDYDVYYFNNFIIKYYIKNHIIEISKLGKHINKIILHNINEELYILPQKSGSCTWFSIYWPIIMYNVFSHSYTKYKEHIILIITECNRILNNFFNKDKLLTFRELDFGKYTFLKILCNKLIDINIIDKNVLSDEYDFIYSININYNYIKNKVENLFDNYTFKLIMMIKNYNEKFDNLNAAIFNNITDILTRRYSDMNITLDILYNAYLIYNNNINFFNNIDITMIDDILRYDTTNNTSKNKQVIIAINSNNILLELYKNSSNYIDDIYFNNFYCGYIPFALFLDQYLNKNEFILGEEIDNKMLQFILISYRLILLINIVRYMCFIIQNLDINEERNKENILYIENIKKFINYIFEPEIKDLNYKISHISSTKIIQDEYFIFDNQEFNNSMLNLKIFKFPPKKIYYKENNITIREYNEKFYKMRNFVYVNPQYIYINLDKTKILKNNFIELNIFDIIKQKKIYIYLLKFHLTLFYYYNVDKSILDFQELINNLQLLLFKTRTFRNLKKMLDEFKKIYNCDEFINYIIDNQENLINYNNIYIKIANTGLNFTIGESEDKIIIGQTEFLISKIQESNLLQYFGKENNLYLIENSEKKREIYIILEKSYIRMNINIDNHIEKIFYKHILHNEIEIIKYNNIKYPFKYVIPIHCFHIVYELDNEYNIIFFNYKSKQVDSNNNEIETFLKNKNNYNLLDGIYKFTINPNTNFYLNFKNNNEIMNFKNLCLDYHVNKYNIMYIYPENDKSTLKNGYYYNPIINYDYDKKLFIEKVSSFDYKTVTIINDNNLDGDNDFEYIINHKLVIKRTEEKSFLKLLKKIRKYILNNEKCINKLGKYKLKLDQEIKEYTEQIKYYSIRDIIKQYNKLYEYLLNIRILNFINKLLYEFKNDNIDNVIGYIKIYDELFNTKKQMFNYNFEILFELLNGNELLEEQMEKYIQIIDSFDKYDKYSKIIKPIYNKKLGNNEYIFQGKAQIGGHNIFPLHHFMMGKGKSKILTPILTLLFTILYKKSIYIIVPEHLKNQTSDIICLYSYIFKIDDYINIVTDTQVKELFLEGKFKDNEENKNNIMLIDEFDNILDPLQSNFNIIIEQDKIGNGGQEERKGEEETEEETEENKESKYINLNIFIGKICKNVNEDNLEEFEYDSGFNKEIEILILDEIKKILKNIREKILKQNINWGIHPTKCYAIPYKAKDLPLLNSNFSSIIVTIFLTFYYYTKINNLITDELVFFLNKYNLVKTIFLLKVNNFLITKELLEENIKSETDREEKFRLIINEIISKIKRPNYRYNTSFVDIININNIFKIGYSGTMNINLPLLPLDEDNFRDITIDYDERINIVNALREKELLIGNNNILGNQEQIKTFIKELNEYDAIIDIIGLLKDFDNQYIAFYLHNELDTYKDIKRDIIFLDKQDKKLVVTDNKIEEFNENKKYYKPFIYYSNKHIIGIDIKQDYYPILNGICIMDENTRYTIAAQAISRLRKLNMGHTIQIILFTKETTINDIVALLNINDEKYNTNSKNYLVFQTIKSIIRKNRIITDPFQENYKEKIYSIYLHNNLEITSIDNIFNEDEITEHCRNLIVENNIEQDIKKLVYGIDSSEFHINIEQELDQEQEQERDKSFDYIIEVENIKNVNTYDMKDYPQYFLKKHFIPIDELLQIVILVEMIKDNKILYLPSIFSDMNLFSDINDKKTNINMSGYAFLFISNMLILIPGYLIIEYIDNYIITDIFFNILNSDLHQKPLFDEFENLVDIFSQFNIIKLLQKRKYVETRKIPLIIPFIVSFSIIDRSFFNITRNDTTINGMINEKFEEYCLKYDIQKKRSQYIYKYIKYKIKYIDIQKKFIKTHSKTQI